MKCRGKRTWPLAFGKISFLFLHFNILIYFPSWSNSNKTSLGSNPNQTVGIGSVSGSMIPKTLQAIMNCQRHYFSSSCELVACSGSNKGMTQGNSWPAVICHQPKPAKPEVTLVFTYTINSSHSPAAPLSARCQRIPDHSRSDLPSAGHRSSGTCRGCARSWTARKCIPAGAAPAVRAPSLSVCTPGAGSLCPCRPPSAHTRNSWSCLRRTKRLSQSLWPAGWRFPPPEPRRRGDVGAKFCFWPNPCFL